MSEGLKWCATCGPNGAWQPLAAFARDRSKGDGRQSRCRACCQRLRAQRAGQASAEPYPVAARRLVWTLECVLCGGHEETAWYPLLRPVYCWRDRSRLLLSVERLTGSAARLDGAWGTAPALADVMTEQRQSANEQGW